MISFTDPAIHQLLQLVSLVCFGIWIVTYQAQHGRWRFELFAIDFGIGAFLLSLFAALFLGSYGTDLPFNDRLLVASKTSEVMMAIAGVIFGVGNTLLLGAVSLLGVAGAFGIAGGLALAIGIVLNHSSAGVPFPIVAALFIVSMLLAAWASRATDSKRTPHPRGQPSGPIQLRRSTKGILVAVLGGIAISAAYPLALRGAFDDFGLGPYAGLFLFCTGLLAINVFMSLYFFNIALEGGALRLRSYLKGWPGRHLPGIFGGGIWAVGGLAALLAHRTGPGIDIPPTVVGCLPLSAVPLAMLLGIVFWRELANRPRPANIFLLASLVVVAAGVAALMIG